MAERPYSRIYWSVFDDPKFDTIRGDAAHFGSWALMLTVADMAHPVPAFVPPTVPQDSLDALVAAGLVDVLPGRLFRIHGLAKERAMRSDKASNAAAVRWHSDSTANPMPRRDETRKDETSTARAGAGGAPRGGPMVPFRELVPPPSFRPAPKPSQAKAR